MPSSASTCAVTDRPAVRADIFPRSMPSCRTSASLSRSKDKTTPVCRSFYTVIASAGCLTLAYAIQYGEGLKGVIVSGAGLRSAVLEQKGKVALVNLLGSLLPGLTIPTGLPPETISRDPDVVQKYLADPLVHDKSSLGLAKAGFSAIDLCFARAKELRPPLLIMHGKADRSTYASGSVEFAKLAGATNKDVTLKLWEGMYHELHNEPEQAEVFKVMIEWLDRHL